MASRSNAFIAGFQASLAAPEMAQPTDALRDAWMLTWNVFLDGWRAARRQTEPNDEIFPNDDGENCNISSGRRVNRNAT